jgi:hypothetical protein
MHIGHLQAGLAGSCQFGGIWGLKLGPPGVCFGRLMAKLSLGVCAWRCAIRARWVARSTGR